MKKELIQALARPLKAAGFRRRGQLWYWDTPELIHVVYLRRFQFSDQHVVDCGIWLSKIETNEFPRMHKCQIHGDFRSLFPEFRAWLYDAAALDRTSTTLLIQLERHIGEDLVPYLKSISTEDDIIRELTTDGARLRRLLILGATQYYLGLTDLL